MNKILTDLSPAAVTNANMANLQAYLCCIRGAPHTTFYQDELLSRWHTRLAHPWMNGVLCVQPPREGAEVLVDEQIAYFQSRQVQAFTWWLAPELPLSSWEGLLSARGFSHQSDLFMSLDLMELVEPTGAPEGLRIATVQDTDILRVWANVFVRGFGLPLDWEQDVYDLQFGPGLGWPNQVYLAYLDDVPVATATVYLAAGVAGIVNVATVSEARRKGIGAAVTSVALRDARALGYRVATLQASEMGASVYRRLGFRYECERDHFYWRSSGSVTLA